MTHWLAGAELEAQESGYFLVPAVMASASWRLVPRPEADRALGTDCTGGLACYPLLLSGMGALASCWQQASTRTKRPGRRLRRPPHCQALPNAPPVMPKEIPCGGRARHRGITVSR